MNRLNVLKKYSMNLKNYTDKFQFEPLYITLPRADFYLPVGVLFCSLMTHFTATMIQKIQSD